MAVQRYPFDLQNGTTLTVANTGATQVTNGAGSTATASGDHPHAGPTGAKFSGAASQNSIARFPVASDVNMRFSMYFWYWGTPRTAAERVFGGRQSGTPGYFGDVDTTGKLRILHTGGTAVFTATAALPSAGLYRLEGYVAAASATVGTMTFAYFTGDSLTPIQSTNITTGNFNTGNWAAFDVGRLSVGTQQVDVYVDSVQLESSATPFTGFIGPYIVNVPILISQAVRDAAIW